MSQRKRWSFFQSFFSESFSERASKSDRRGAEGAFSEVGWARGGAWRSPHPTSQEQVCVRLQFTVQLQPRPDDQSTTNMGKFSNFQKLNDAACHKVRSSDDYLMCHLSQEVILLPRIMRTNPCVWRFNSTDSLEVRNKNGHRQTLHTVKNRFLTRCQKRQKWTGWW